MTPQLTRYVVPDFRSPKTGLYHNLARLNLPHPEAVFEIDFFRKNPVPFYLLAKELYPGNFYPTISHVFIALLAKKKLLRMLFTQNIDCLERAAGVPADRIIEAHGSFATQRCIECRTPFPDDLMKEYVKRGEAPHCVSKTCNGLVKPDIVFFGEQLPAVFHSNVSIPSTADLVLVMGTSLMVQPFAGLPSRARDGVPRLLFNLDRVGDLGSRVDDVLELGDCDTGVRKLADALGWRDELEAMWRGIVGEKEAERQLSKTQKEAAINKELDDIVDDISNKLDISEGGKAEMEANTGTQDRGSDRTPHKSRGHSFDSKTGTPTAYAGKLVGGSSTCPAGDVAGTGGADPAQSSKEEKPEVKEHIKNPITIDHSTEVESKGGNDDKPAL